MAHVACGSSREGNYLHLSATFWTWCTKCHVALTNANFFGWLMSYVGFLVGRSVKDIQRQATAPADALASTSKVSCGSCTHRAPTVHLLCTHRTWRAHHKRVELAGDLQLAFQIHIIEIYWDSSSVYTLSSSELPIWPWSTSMAFTTSDASSRVSSWHNAMAHRPGPWTLVCGRSVNGSLSGLSGLSGLSSLSGLSGLSCHLLSSGKDPNRSQQ